MDSINQSNKSTFKTIMSYAGWGIGLLGLLVAIYTGFIKRDEPRLEYDIVSSTKFINDEETSAQLKIFVDSIDIQKSHLNISAFQIKVENKGTAHIRYDDYDNGPFGLTILDGKLLEQPIIVDAYSEHIKSCYPKKDTIAENSFVYIPTISLDIDGYYILRVVLIHEADKVPQFLPVGKIVGQKTIPFNTLQAEMPGFWSIVFSGNLLVQVVRFFFYLICVVVFVIIVAYVASGIDGVVGKRKRKKQIKELSKTNSLSDFVCDDYIKDGKPIVIHMYELYQKNESVISSQYRKSKGFIQSKQGQGNKKHRDWRLHENRYNRIKKYIDKGYLVEKEDGTIAFNQAAKNTVFAINSLLS